MQSRERKNKPTWPFNKSVATRRNGQLMWLLTMVPEFQRDVANLRKEYDMPAKGYRPDIEDGMSEAEERRALEKWRREIDRKLQSLGNFSPSKIGRDDIGLVPNLFQEAVQQIGRKFNLPYNLCNGSYWGVAYYLVTNEILVPQKNWDIKIQPQQDGRLPILWAEIRAYAPLSQVEIKEATTELNKVLGHHLPAGLADKQRIHDKDEDNLAKLAASIEKRNLKAEGRAQYKAGSYLATAHKNINKNAKQMRVKEKRNPHDVIALKALSQNERKMLDRSNKLALKFFGHSILKKDNKRYS